MSNNKVCFIIAHKYFRGYESYLSYYIGNIQKHYPEALVIVVDNNSRFTEDVFGPLRGMDNVVLLTNDIESKLELGAYQVGVRYIVDNGLTDEYAYYICSQDNFVLKNRFDFNTLVESNTYALPVNSMYADGNVHDVTRRVLTDLGMYDNLDKINFCWCNTFIVASRKLNELYGYLKQIVMTTRHESCGSERYLARLLWEMNERRDCGDIDGSAADLHVRHYDTWQVNIYDDATSFFVKKVQQKNEHTQDKDIPQPIIHVPDPLHKAAYERNKNKPQ